jgi:predicted transcriptional regulator
MKKRWNGRFSTADRPKGPVCRMVAAYVSNNKVPPDGVAPLIGAVHHIVAALRSARDRAESPLMLPTPVEAQDVFTPDGPQRGADDRSYWTLRLPRRRRGLPAVAYRRKAGFQPTSR